MEVGTLWSQTELHGHKTRGIRSFLFSLTVNVSGTCGLYTHSAPTHSIRGLWVSGGDQFRIGKVNRDGRACRINMHLEITLKVHHIA
jgi:hypothetical protein